MQVLAVIVLGVIPITTSPLTYGMDWVIHFLEFMVLMTWFGGVASPGRHFYVAIGLVLLGVLIEVSQAMNIFRSFDLKDIVANTAGVVAGLLLVRTWLRNWCYRCEVALGGFRS